MDVLVSDTSVVIDLERAELIERVFSLPYRFIVPRRLYENEIKDYGGEHLLELGLVVRSLTSDQMVDAQRLRSMERRISIYDSFALSLAKAEAAILLSGDAALRSLAALEDVRCHGVLWLFDRLEEHQTVAQAELHACLTRLAVHPRCRLPTDAVRQRLIRYVPSKRKR